MPDDLQALRDHLKDYAEANGLDHLKAAAVLFDSFLGDIHDEPETGRIFPPDEGWYFQ